MRTVVLWGLMAAGLVTMAVGAMPDRIGVPGRGPAAGQPVTCQGGLMALSAVVEGKYQQVTIIEPARQVMCVYHIDLASGNVKLRCVRNFQWDLQMLQHNGESPLPQDIRSALESM